MVMLAQLQWVVTRLIPGDFAICTVMSGNGARMLIRINCREVGILSDRKKGLIEEGSFGAAVG